MIVAIQQRNHERGITEATHYHSVPWNKIYTIYVWTYIYFCF